MSPLVTTSRSLTALDWYFLEPLDLQNNAQDDGMGLLVKDDTHNLSIKQSWRFQNTIDKSFAKMAYYRWLQHNSDSWLTETYCLWRTS